MNPDQLLEELSSVPVARIWNTLFGTDVEEDSVQNISCPLHGGEDKNPSARIYPSSNKIHCWGCGKTRDSIQVVRDALAQEGDTSFKDVIDWLSRNIFGSVIVVPDEDEQDYLEVAAKVVFAGWVKARLSLLSESLWRYKKYLTLETYASSFYAVDAVEHYLGSWDQDVVLNTLETVQSRILSDIGNHSNG